MQTKIDIRRQLRRTRQSLPRATRQRAQLVSNRFLKQLIKRNKRIGIYYAVGSEMGLDEFIRSAQRRGAKIYLPYIEPKTLCLWFTAYRAEYLSKPKFSGSLNIPQCAGRKIRAHQLHVLILPMIAVDKSGYRLGQGGGYYDASLAATRHRLQPRTVAVGFACQLVDELPHEAHDVPIDEFVCENGRYLFK